MLVIICQRLKEEQFVQINYLPEIIKKRNENFFKFAAIFNNKDKFYPLKYDHLDFLSNFAFPVICKSQKIRDELVGKCAGLIEIRPIVAGDMVMQPFYSKYMKKFSLPSPNAKLVHEQGLYFGNNPELTKDEIASIIKIFSFK